MDEIINKKYFDGLEICKKYDLYMKNHLEFKSKNKEIQNLSKKILSFIDKKEEIEVEDVNKYNLIIRLNEIIKRIAKFTNSKNKFSVLRAFALKNGTTIYYYMSNKNDNEFIEIIVNILKNLL